MGSADSRPSLPRPTTMDQAATATAHCQSPTTTSHQATATSPNSPFIPRPSRRSWYRVEQRRPTTTNGTAPLATSPAPEQGPRARTRPIQVQIQGLDPAREGSSPRPKNPRPTQSLSAGNEAKLKREGQGTVSLSQTHGKASSTKITVLHRQRDGPVQKNVGPSR